MHQRKAYVPQSVLCTPGADALEWFPDNMIGVTSVEKAKVTGKSTDVCLFSL